MTHPDDNSRVEEIIRAFGSKYERLIKGRHEHERMRKRAARQRQQLEQLLRERARKREARERQTLEQIERERLRQQSRCRTKIRSFMGVDGEGGGTDKIGRQNYFLMIAAGKTAGDEHILHRQGRHLTTAECLEFLLSLPAEPILVGYGFGYDVTQILRGIKERTLRSILKPRQGKNGPCYTYWGDYAIIYQQGQYLRVARVDRRGPEPTVIKGSCRTVYETIGFFQCSFVKAIGDWDIGSHQERTIVEANKGRRDQFVQLTDEIVRYCKMECHHLAMLMTELREKCAAAGIVPRQWSGAGWLASALLDKHGVPKRPLTQMELAALAERRQSKRRQPAAGSITPVGTRPDVRSGRKPSLLWRSLRNISDRVYQSASLSRRHKKRLPSGHAPAAVPPTHAMGTSVAREQIAGEWALFSKGEFLASRWPLVWPAFSAKWKFVLAAAGNRMVLVTRN